MSQPMKYVIRGEWVDEPFVAFGTAEMVMYSDYEALQLESAESKLAAQGYRELLQESNAQIERLKAPVSDEEWLHIHLQVPNEITSHLRIAIENLIASRATQPAPQDSVQSLKGDTGK